MHNNLSRHLDRWYFYFGLTIFIFIPSIFNGFLSWDDDTIILRNAILRLDFFNAVKTYFSNTFFADYTPLTHLTFLFEFKLFGERPYVYHLTNIFFHGLNVVLVNHLISYFPRLKRYQIFLVLIFSLHPLQVESVSWIGERKGVLSTFFLLLTCYFHIKKRYFIAPLFFICALLSKGSLLAFFLLITGGHFSFGDKLKKSFYYALPYFIIGLIFTFIRFSAFEASSPHFKEIVWSNHLLHLPIKTPSVVGHYFWKSLFPFYLSPIYVLYKFNFINTFLALIGYVLIAYPLVQIFLGKKAYALPFTLFIFPLIPYLHVIPWIHYINDRYMYLPIIGLFSLLFLISRSFKFNTNTLKLLVSCYILFFLGMNLYYQSLYKNNQTFWTYTTKNAPFSPIAWNNLGKDQLQREKVEDAIDSFEKCLITDYRGEQKYLCLNNLGFLHSKDKTQKYYDIRKAKEYYYKAYKIATTQMEAIIPLYNLANAYIDGGDEGKGIDLLMQITNTVRNSTDKKLQFIYQKGSQRINEYEKKRLEKRKN